MYNSSPIWSKEKHSVIYYYYYWLFQIITGPMRRVAYMNHAAA